MRDFIKPYNDNLYINLIIVINDGLKKIGGFLENIVETRNIDEIEHLTIIYNEIFYNELIKTHLSFKIERIYKSLYLRNPGPFTRGNSYYHLTLALKTESVKKLDQLYNSKLTKLLKLLKVLFSNIDNFYIERDLSRLQKYQEFLIKNQKDIQVFIDSVQHREIIEKREKLNPEDFERIPYGGFFYMAHIDNLKSILDLGILSHNLAHDSGIVKVDISNRVINEKRNRIEPKNGFSIHDYSPLYITPKNPMHKSLNQKDDLDNIVFFKINPHILLTGNVLFSDGNAAEESTKFYNNIKDFNKLNWQCIRDTYWEMYQDGKRIRCSEVLILKKIPNYYITEIYSNNDATYLKILSLFPNHLGIKVSTENEIFFWEN